MSSSTTEPVLESVKRSNSLTQVDGAAQSTPRLPTGSVAFFLKEQESHMLVIPNLPSFTSKD